MSGEHSLSEITALDVIEHLNVLLAYLMDENRELERTIAQRDRKIELLLGAGCREPAKEAR
jgi:hypothetical protein